MFVKVDPEVFFYIRKLHLDADIEASMSTPEELEGFDCYLWDAFGGRMPYIIPYGFAIKLHVEPDKHELASVFKDKEWPMPWAFGAGHVVSYVHQMFCMDENGRLKSSLRLTCVGPKLRRRWEEEGFRVVETQRHPTNNRTVYYMEL